MGMMIVVDAMEGVVLTESTLTYRCVQHLIFFLPNIHC
jgi:hypothetical protein